MLAIVSALQEEQDGILALMDDPVKTEVANRVFWSGSMYNVPVVLTLSKIGKVSAAMTTTLILNKFPVKWVIFTGVAGGIGDGVKVGDVVVATGFIQYDMDGSPLFPQFEIPLYEKTHFQTDKGLQHRLSIAAYKSLELIKGEYPNTTMHAGLILTGDQFVSTDKKAKELLRQFHGMATSVEMEGAAVAQVCHDHNIPFGAIRTISDRADEEAHVSFPQFVAKTASVFSRELVETMMGESLWPGDQRILAQRKNPKKLVHERTE